MRRVTDIFGIVAIVLVIISVVMMPWPANVAIGGLLFITAMVILIYNRRVKKRGRNTNLPDRPQNDPLT